MRKEKEINDKGLRTKKRHNKYKKKKSLAEVKYKKRKEEIGTIEE